MHSIGGLHSPYVKPEIVDHGSLADLTAAGSTGGFTDASFPAGTPVGNLTYGSTP